jgi:hypothetical protein
VLTGVLGNFVGASVAPAGDLDGDERADLIVGASGFEDAGFAQVLRGADLGVQRLRVAIAPVDGPVQLPPTGGSFDFRLVLRNRSAQAQTIELWMSLITPPARTALSPLSDPVEITLPPGASVQRVLTQSIPGSLPIRALHPRGEHPTRDRHGWRPRALDFTKAAASD